MKPVESPFAAREPMMRNGRGWSVFVDGLSVSARIGIYAHEHAAPQPVVIDARLAYRCEPSDADNDGWIDYDAYCARITSFLAHKPHTRLLETLAVEIAALSFEAWPALDALILALHKPKIRPGTQRIGIELNWTRADYAAWRAGADRASSAIR
ncbi:diguanylate cyclase [Burkholderia singularis]|uniref:Diguanylate cyclase n=1 Tax=Burkholderia singularis TaxID=1503053 RepID=A0A103DW84_9BURK|nr:dihydroneopterin aldolase [Burkholderia singularis]KVE23861.1 diguanylate cyclase [Burkholderia singularis]